MTSMRSTIYRRIVAVVLASVIAVSVLFTIVLYREIETQVHGDVRSRDLLVAKVLDQADSQDVLPTLTRLASTSASYRITLIAADGTPLFDSQAQVATMANHADRPEFIAARATGAGQSTRLSATIGKETYYYAKLLANGQVIRVAQTTSTISGLLLRQLPWMLAAVVVVLLVCLLVARHLTSSLVRPITESSLDGSDMADGPPAVYEELMPFFKQRKEADQLRRQFSANVSHELKTPLTSIVGRAELLEAGLVKPGDVTKFGMSIRKEGQRLIELIEDIMRISQLDESGQLVMQTFLVHSAVSDVFESLEGKAATAQVTLEVAGEDVELTANRSMMFELLYNLVDNAIKYNDPGGSVTIRTAAGQEEKPIIEVIDTGVGIPASDFDRIFERFYRVDPSRSKESGGTGLGLSIVKHIAEHHGAVIELESEIGAGTTVRIKF